MVHYEVNETTGELLVQNGKYVKNNKSYLKLFPYVLFSFSLFGVWIRSVFIYCVLKPEMRKYIIIANINRASLFSLTDFRDS